MYTKTLLIPFNVRLLLLLKEHIRLGHAGIVNHSVKFIDTTLKKKGMDRNKQNFNNII